MSPPPIAKMFFDVSAAIDVAYMQLGEPSRTNLSEVNAAIAAVFARMDSLLARLKTLPEAEMNSYHPPLAHLLNILEEFHQTLLSQRRDTATEMQNLGKHQRAFMAYLTPRKVKQ